MSSPLKLGKEEITGPPGLATDPEIIDPRAEPSAEPRRRPWIDLLIVSDLVALCLAAVVGAFLRATLFGLSEGPTSVAQSMMREVPYVPLFVVTLGGYGMYRRGRRRVRSTSFLDLSQMVHGLLFGGIAVMVLSALLHRTAGVARVGWVEAVFMTAPAVVLLPSAGRALRCSPATRRPATRLTRVVVLGSGAVSSSAIRRLQSVAELDVLGYIEDAGERDDRPMTGRWLGELVELPSICADYQVDRVIVAFTGARSPWVVEILRQLPPSVRISVVPRLFELVTWQSHVEELYGLTVMDVPRPASAGARAS